MADHQPTMSNNTGALKAKAAILNPYLGKSTTSNFAFSNDDDDNGISTSEPAAKRQKAPATSTGTRKRSPTSFVTWNCNGFSSRANWDRSALEKLLKETDYPDMICIQEARLKAYNSTQRGRPSPSEFSGAVQNVIQEVFRDYRPYWSLADKKYAGTLTLIHKRLGKADGESGFTMAFSFNSSINALLQRVSLTRKEVGVKDQSFEKKGPSALPQNNKKQKTLTSFFAPKMPTATNHANSNTGNTSNKATKITSFDGNHHHEGRIQFFSFESMDILQTYVPNNGTTEQSFGRRVDWDQQLLQFVLDRKKILQVSGQSQRPMLWCGDMNVAHDYRDGTHWRKEGDNDDNDNEDSIYEWWTDEEKCFVRGVKKSSCCTDVAEQKDAENVGIPSFTPAERRRFKNILMNGDFVDVWRARYPTGVDPNEGGSSHQKELCKANPWDRPNYTWRGHLAKPGSQFRAKYQGKGQRLDYFLLSPKDNMLHSVDYCKILGYGEQRECLFCGSDHCASLLRLKEM